MFWLAEDHCVVAQSSAPRNVENRLDLHVRLRGLQPGAHAEPDAQRSSDVVSPGRSVSERRSNASFGRLVARKITPQTLKNSRMTQTNLEFAGSARFFSSLLEQLVDDYLMFNGFFTIHNLKFLPSATDPEYVKNKDSVASDIDVVGFQISSSGT